MLWYANAGNWSKASTGPVVLVLGGSGGTGELGHLTQTQVHTPILRQWTYTE